MTSPVMLPTRNPLDPMENIGDYQVIQYDAYLLLVGSWTPAEVKAAKDRLATNTLDVDELVRQGRAIRG